MDYLSRSSLHKPRVNCLLVAAERQREHEGRGLMNVVVLLFCEMMLSLFIITFHSERERERVTPFRLFSVFSNSLIKLGPRPFQSHDSRMIIILQNFSWPTLPTLNLLSHHCMLSQSDMEFSRTRSLIQTNLTQISFTNQISFPAISVNYFGLEDLLKV